MFDLEETEYTYRGAAYIDGIAKTFEARNYFALIVSFVTSLTIEVLSIGLWPDLAIGIIVGLGTTYYLIRFSKGAHKSSL